MEPGKFIILILLAFSLITCEEKTFNELTGDGTLLKEIVADGEVNYKFTYNNANLIKEEKSKYFFTEHFYNHKNQLIQTDNYFDNSIASSNSSTLEEALNKTDWVTPENTEKSSYSTFEYNGEYLISSIIHRSDNTKNHSTYEYSSGLITKRTSYVNEVISAVVHYSYDENKNMIKSEKYFYSPDSELVLSSTHEFVFDDKNNPYRAFWALLIPGKHTNKNNIVKETYTIYSAEDGTVEDIQTTEFTYQYNEKGFPVKRSDGIEYTYY